jgi:hypothetical protein
MAFHPHKDLKYILHPYIFVLKENQGIQNDLFDYSLWMMRISPETIRSPKGVEGKKGIVGDDFDALQAYLNFPSLL